MRKRRKRCQFVSFPRRRKLEFGIHKISTVNEKKCLLFFILKLPVMMLSIICSIYVQQLLTLNKGLFKGKKKSTLGDILQTLYLFPNSIQTVFRLLSLFRLEYVVMKRMSRLKITILSWFSCCVKGLHRFRTNYLSLFTRLDTVYIIQ